MSVLKEAWDTLRTVATIVDKVAVLSEELKSVREENRQLRDRLIRIETIIDEARRRGSERALPKSAT